jgi:hypothetical protein
MRALLKGQVLKQLFCFAFIFYDCANRPHYSVFDVRSDVLTAVLKIRVFWDATQKFTDVSGNRKTFVVRVDTV